MPGRYTGGGRGCGSGQGLLGCNAVKWAVEPIEVRCTLFLGDCAH